MTSWVIGNWKLNPASLEEVNALVTDLTMGIEAQDVATNNCQIVVAPSFLHLSAVKLALDNAKASIGLASQDVSALNANTGAYTGDISAAQLSDLGVQWSIIGHSERRQYHREDDASLLQKLMNSAEHNLGAILCIGESEADYEAGNTQKVLGEQLNVVNTFLKQLTKDLGDKAADYIANRFIVAYEPVWAIGTGKVPSVEEVAEVHAFIRQRLSDFNASLATTPLLYGGSVKPENAKDFAALEAVDGVLVGGAALKADSFIEIAKSFSS